MANALLIPDLNLTREARWDNAKQDDTRYFLSEVEVLGQTSSKAIVALGDSLTDGVGIENDHYDRWTDFLAQRLQQNSRHIVLRYSMLESQATDSCAMQKRHLSAPQASIDLIMMSCNERESLP